jgi:hypothetical protein
LIPELHIAIIDDGVNENRFNTGPLIHNIEITPRLKVKERRGYDTFVPCHGTACAAIIKKYAPQVRLSSIKVLNKSNRGLCAQLIKAIEWCMTYKIRLLHMSIGTIDYHDFAAIQNIINRASFQGIIIVAACNNKNIITYPASLSNVIGVRCYIDRQLQEGDYRYNTYPFNGIEISACGRHTIMSGHGKMTVTSPCNSFAAPMITALVYNIMQANPGISLQHIKHELQKNASNNLCKAIQPLRNKPDWISKAIVINFNQGNSIDALPFVFSITEIVQVQSENDNINRTFTNIINSLSQNKWKKTDTIILLTDNSVEKEGLCTLIRTIGKYDKSIIYINKSDPSSIPVWDSNLRIWYPAFIGKYTEDYNEAIPEDIDIPIIAICNNSEKEAVLFTSTLTNYFKTNGYHAVVCSNDPMWIMLGFEYISMSLLNGNASHYLRNLSHAYNPDILILHFDKNDEIILNTPIDIKLYLENNKAQEQFESGKNDIKWPGNKVFHVQNKKQIEKVYKYIEIALKKGENLRDTQTIRALF